MALVLTLADCSTNPAQNGPDGSVDPPSMLDDQQRLALSFIAQLRDGAGIPVGMCVPFIGGTSAPGWIKGNGALVSRTTYPALFAYASAQGLVSESDWTAGSCGRFSVGDGSTTFRLPDTRALFIRGLDEGRGLDTGRLIGVLQDHAVAPHTHGVTDPTHGHTVADPGHVHTTTVNGNHQHGYVGQQATGGAGGVGAVTIYNPVSAATDGAGDHSHNVNGSFTGVAIVNRATGISIQSAGTEGHPRNLAWPMFIKY